jgi:hypothetical protein
MAGAGGANAGAWLTVGATAGAGIAVWTLETGIALSGCGAVFRLVRVASASKMALALGAAGAVLGAGCGCRMSFGGVPIGVVDRTSIGREERREATSDTERRLILVPSRDRSSLLDGALSFSLKEFNICAGKVAPRSQISISFLIFS